MGYGIKGWSPRGYKKNKNIESYLTANISTTGRPRVKIKVSKQLTQSTASDEIIKVVPPLDWFVLQKSQMLLFSRYKNRSKAYLPYDPLNKTTVHN